MAPNSSSPAMIKRHNSAKQLYGNSGKIDPELIPIVDMGYKLASYYIPYHLRYRCKHESLQGLPKNYVVPPQQPPELYLRVADMCCQMEKRFTSFFEQVPNHMAKKKPKQVFISLCHSVLKSDVNWGRIISIFTLGGSFAVHFVNTGELDMVKSIPSWIQEVIEKTEGLAQWIQNQGGWVRTFNNLRELRTFEKFSFIVQWQAELFDFELILLPITVQKTVVWLHVTKLLNAPNRKLPLQYNCEWLYSSRRSKCIQIVSLSVYLMLRRVYHFFFDSQTKILT